MNNLFEIKDDNTKQKSPAYQPDELAECYKDFVPDRMDSAE